MIAPSEKHLEDWIVANFNRFGVNMDIDGIPDYAIEGCFRLDENTALFPFYRSLVSRQLILPAGIPDLIVSSEKSVAVVELKKGAVTYDTIGQCLRYMHELREIYWWTFHDAISPENPDADAYLYDANYQLEITENPQSEITGMVVGNSISDRNLALVAATCQIEVVTYDYDGGEYVFEHECIEPHGSLDDYKRQVNTALGREMRRTMQARVNEQRRMRQGSEVSK